MSGIAKGIGKVFSAIGNVVKKVAAPLLAIGAIVFTGGAALGLAPLAAGWGGAVTAGLTAIGAPAGGVLSSVITQAGAGAAIGAGVSAVTGGDPLKGAAMGAMGGALTGGVTGLAGGIGGGAAAPAAPQGMQLAAMSGRNLGPAVQTGAVVPNTGLTVNPTSTFMQQMQPATQTGRGLGGIFGSVGDFMKTEGGGSIVGQTISGMGQGLMTGMAANDAAEADREEQERITASYNVNPGVLAPAYAQPSSRPSPERRWGRIYFDRNRREIVRERG